MMKASLLRAAVAVTAIRNSSGLVVAVRRLRTAHSQARMLSDAIADFDVLGHASGVAEAAARKAGKEIIAGMGSKVQKEKLNFKDIVTEVANFSLNCFAL